MSALLFRLRCFSSSEGVAVLGLFEGLMDEGLEGRGRFD